MILEWFKDWKINSMKRYEVLGIGEKRILFIIKV